jgi:hypothetical protein
MTKRKGTYLNRSKDAMESFQFNNDHGFVLLVPLLYGQQSIFGRGR